jgi:hypothetical protein
MTREPLHADAARHRRHPQLPAARATCTSTPTLGAALQERIHAINLSRRQ